MSIVTEIERAFFQLRRRNVEPARIWLREEHRIALAAELSEHLVHPTTGRSSYKGVPITLERTVGSRVVAVDGRAVAIVADLSNKKPKT